MAERGGHAELFTTAVARLAAAGSDVVVFADGTHIELAGADKRNGAKVDDNGWVVVTRDGRPHLMFSPQHVVGVARARRSPASVTYP